MQTTEPTSKSYKEKRKEKKKFKRNYGAFLYSSFIKLAFLVYMLGLVLSLEDNYPFFSLKNFAIAFVISTVIIIVLWFMRRLYIAHKIMGELDMRIAYELDKRPLPFFKNHNYKLLYYTHFFVGDFLNAISVCDEALEHTKNKNYTLLARHTKILSLFFSEETENIKELIHKQRELKTTMKGTDFDFMFRQYQFIEVYLDADYERAMETIIDFLGDEKESIYNSRKIVFMQFQKMLCIKNNDTEGVQNCNLEILKCDSERRTFFSKIIVS